MVSSKLVWTSDPEQAKKLRESGKGAPRREAAVASQTIRVAIDRKRRAGKSVTLASGFEHGIEEMSNLASQLKKRCGAGGTVKDGDIEIQGEHVETVVTLLETLGYRVRK
ncbi:MAG: translation initiation factor [Acidobacteriota bacterium]